MNIKALKFANKPSFHVSVVKYPINLKCSANSYASSDVIQGKWYNLHSKNDTIAYNVTKINNKVVVEAKIERDGRYVCQINHLTEEIKANTIVEILFVGNYLFKNILKKKNKHYEEWY